MLIKTDITLNLTSAISSQITGCINVCFLVLKNNIKPSHYIYAVPVTPPQTQSSLTRRACL